MAENHPVLWGLLKGIGLLAIGLSITFVVGAVLQARAVMGNGASPSAERSFFVDKQLATPVKGAGSVFEPGRALFTPEVVSGR